MKNYLKEKKFGFFYVEGLNKDIFFHEEEIKSAGIDVSLFSNPDIDLYIEFTLTEYLGR